MSNSVLVELVTQKSLRWCPHIHAPYSYGTLIFMFFLSSDSLSKMSSHSLSKISPRRTRSSTAAEGRPSRSAARNVPQAATISQKKRFTTAHHQQSPLRKSAAPAGQAKTVNKEPLEANGICTKPIKPDPKPVEIAEGMVANVNGNVAKRPALEEKVVAEEPASTANSNSGRSAKRQKMNETKLQKVKSFKKGTFKSSKFVGAHISTSGECLKGSVCRWHQPAGRG